MSALIIGAIVAGANVIHSGGWEGGGGGFVCSIPVGIAGQAVSDAGRPGSQAFGGKVECFTHIQVHVGGFQRDIPEDGWKQGMLGDLRGMTGNKSDLTHSERRPQNIYYQEEMNIYCIIKLATEISLFSLQISKT